MSIPSEPAVATSSPVTGAGTIAAALIYLRFTSMAGRIRFRLQRLRQPKYLIGSIVGVAYIYYFFLRRVGRSYNPGVPAFTGDVPELLPSLAALGLACVALASWLLPRSRAGLNFTEAEIAFLFPAPIKRRTLIHYRLVSSQVALAFTALILSLFSNRWRFLGGNAVTHAFGWWIMLATINLHFAGSSFAITRLMDRGVTSLRRRLITLAIVAVVLVATVGWLARSVRLPDANDLAGASAVSHYLSTVLTSGPLAWLLAIPKLAVAPFLAPDVRGFALALPAAVLLLVAHYVWVLRTEVAFEEVSLARAEKRAARLQAFQKGNTSVRKPSRKVRRDPFLLRAAGRPEVAFLWKNLLAGASYLRPRTAIIAAVVIVAGCTWLANASAYRPLLGMVLTLALLAGGMALVLGPQLIRQDLRADLRNADMLKTYPLRGWQVVLGEMLMPLVVLSVVLWLCILAVVVALPAREIAGMTPSLRVAAGIGVALLAPPVCALQLLVQNGVAVIFPAWAESAGNRIERGLDVMGQRIIFLVGQIVVAAVALIPGAIVGAIVYFLGAWLVGPFAGAAFAVVGVLFILCVELAVGIRLIGAQFERFDLSSELRP